ncbi:MAG: heavy metal-responsive transcriptional regulator [Acidobacteria bacterium]|nr:MAG: heavy metal-responsive transcriptional regulator [Acidobacteriota bacterium]
MSEKTWMRSGQLAQACGISTDTLRHYERCGLIPKPKRLPNGYRQYPADTLNRVRTIQAALSIGFTLKELSRIFQTRDHGGVPCRHVRNLAEEKLKEIQTQLRLLSSARDHLRTVIRKWDKHLRGVAEGERAKLLETLPLPNTDPHQRIPLFKSTLRKRRTQQ